ncbi:TPA: hypothetical protein H3L48_004397 [Escherichia coli]|uniref:hypothetical protein n=1 Tax=Escherichia coli TaxID=562 RepID=UPI000DDADD77|nr:hypothetical protein [Escherichia coli]KAB3383042.1 hypothetical protein F9005_21560 [Escherichia coli]KAB3443567.1 hypothetical protein F9Z49_21880 [Escherichia coli]MBC9103795.1 hypothetical protein [Escherichia coli]MBL7541942.1 hypothetical protein [Escherichia coli]MBU0225450.1 hypothetical protein [Escherichia coli]
MFDKYISLGDNCEAGLNFSRIGYEYSSLLRFAMTPSKSLIDLFNNNFENIFEEILPVSNNMCQCQKYKISFHTKMHSEMVDGVRKYKNNIDIQSLHNIDLEKIAYLREKFLSDMKSQDHILYFLKSKQNLPKEYVLEIYNKIAAYGGNPTLLVLSENIIDPVESESIYYEQISKFAPYTNAYDYDKTAWDEIFSKYPLNNHEVNIKNGLIAVEL